MKPERVTDISRPQFTALFCRKQRIYKPVQLHPIRMLTFDEYMEMLESMIKDKE